MFNFFLELVVYLMNAMYMATVFDVDELFLPIKKQLDSNQFTCTSYSKNNTNNNKHAHANSHAKENSTSPSSTTELPFERLTQSVASLLSPPSSPSNKNQPHSPLSKASPKRNASFTDLFAQSSSSYSNLIVLNAHYEQMIMDMNNQTTNTANSTICNACNSSSTVSSNVNTKENKETPRKDKIKQTPLSKTFSIPTIQIDAPPMETNSCSQSQETISLLETPPQHEQNPSRRRSNSFFPIQQQITLAQNGMSVDQHHENPILMVIPPQTNDVSNGISNNNPSIIPPTITRKKSSLTNLLKQNFPQPTICKLATLHN